MIMGDYFYIFLLFTLNWLSSLRSDLLETNVSYTDIRKEKKNQCARNTLCYSWVKNCLEQSLSAYVTRLWLFSEALFVSGRKDGHRLSSAFMLDGSISLPRQSCELGGKRKVNSQTTHENLLGCQFHHL